VVLRSGGAASPPRAVKRPGTVTWERRSEVAAAVVAGAQICRMPRQAAMSGVVSGNAEWQQRNRTVRTATLFGQTSSPPGGGAVSQRQKRSTYRVMAG